MTDAIPDGLTFHGNVQKNGKATTEYSYDAASPVLTLSPYAIAPDTQVIYTFDVTVDDGTHGEYIVNTAILHDGDEITPMPDADVEIDAGKTAPIVNKSASVQDAKVGDMFTYTITATNGNKATTAWKILF